ncbi:MAG: NADP-dependent methylenetetrahydromethanopterin/methylenetetrahydrofolate dehydrogenase [Proteobacteria bacterium]|nr:NADP-dependent methylenetetrahydromethanopterin/methylenetetrahydrofolate dehydrogenase [Pseudomonadota bacterium]
MKKLLFQLDTDPTPNIFDTVVAYDGGADHVLSYGNIKSSTVGTMVDGAIFTRPPKMKKNTALFVTGSNMGEGEAVLASVCNHFFGEFRVSVMLDSNGSNTTAAAAVATISLHVNLAGKRVVVLAGTGPIGQRAGVMLAQEGAEVILTSRRVERAETACEAMHSRFGVKLIAAAASDRTTIGRVLEGANIILATGAAGVELIHEDDWKGLPDLEILMDANATPPLGIQGVDIKNRASAHHGKLRYGALGFGSFKLEVHRACIARLFETNDAVLDAPEIFELAKAMVMRR